MPKTFILSVVLFGSLLGLSALADPAETPVKGADAAKLARSFQNKKLVCSPADRQSGDADVFPLTVATEKSASGTVFTVANSRGDDGLSNCSCSRGTYWKNRLRLLDGDDDNYRDLILTINPADARVGNTVRGQLRDLSDDLTPWSVRNLSCTVEALRN